MTITLIKKGLEVTLFKKTIKLTKDKKAIYSSDKVTGHMFRRALELKDKQEKYGLSEQLLNEIGDFVCEVFNYQFTLQELYEGLEVQDVFRVFNNVVLKVIEATMRYQKH